MINIILIFALSMFYVLLTRSIFYLIDYYTSIQKPKYFYFKQLPFEILVTSSIIGIFAILTTVITLIINLIQFIQ